MDNLSFLLCVAGGTISTRLILAHFHGHCELRGLQEIELAFTFSMTHTLPVLLVHGGASL